MSVRCPGRLGPYELLRTLSSGGMGEVFLGRHSSHTGFESLVAIKVLLPHLTFQPGFVRMFLDEARAISRLRHEHIVQILDVEQVESTHFIVMENITGQNLRELIGDVTIEDRPLFPPRLGARLFADLADALATVHRAGLVHRDISPNNIMISDRGVVKLIDFGVVRALDDMSLTTPGTLKGKFGYMAPEYIRGQGYDHRADLFSVGVVMWETFMRRRLFQSTNAAEQIHRVLEADIPRLDALLPRFPPALADLVEGLLERDPTRRVAAASEVAERLQALERALPDERDLTLRGWLERRIPDRIARRRDLERTFMTIEPHGIGSPASAVAPPSSPMQPLAITHTTSANGEAVSRPRARRSNLPLLVVVAALAIVALAATVARRAGEAPPLQPAAAPREAIDEHRTRGIEAMAARDYDRAISEFSEGLRSGGGAELVDLIESARRAKLHSRGSTTR